MFLFCHKFIMSLPLVTCVAFTLLLHGGTSSLETGRDIRLEKLETEVDRLSKQNDELIHLLKELMRDGASTSETHLQKLDQFASYSSTKETSHVFKRQLTGQWVAFTAVIHQVDITNLQSGQAIVFDQIIYDMGSAYDATSGIFTAPIRGLYVFNMDVMVESGHNEYLEFVKDGSHVMYNYAYARSTRDDVSSSRSVVLELNVGEKFWVRITQIPNHGSGTIHGNGFTTFSGYLLRIIE